MQKSPKPVVIHQNEWEEAFNEANTAEVIPTGWKTVQQIADEMNYSAAHARKKITDLLNKGFVESRKFYVHGSLHSRHPAMHYRLKTKTV